MTELQVTSVITTLLLANLLIGAGYTVKNIYVPRGGHFDSEVCQATSNNSRLYWKANTTSIFSDTMAAERGLNTSQMTDRTGRLNQNLTAKNVQYPLNLTCIESLEGEEERVVLSYSIHVKDESDPPSFTGAGDNVHVYDSLNMTNTTTGSQSCGKNCIIAVVVVIAVVAGVGLLAAAIAAAAWLYRRTRRRDRINHDGGHALVEMNQFPPGGNDDDHDNHGDDDSSKDDQAPPVVPQDRTDGTSTMHIPPRPPIRSQPRSNVSRVGPEANSACEPTVAVDIKVQYGNVEDHDSSTMEVTTTGKQCTDEGAITPVYCYKEQTLMHMSTNNKHILYESSKV